MGRSEEFDMILWPYSAIYRGYLGDLKANRGRRFKQWRYWDLIWSFNPVVMKGLI